MFLMLGLRNLLGPVAKLLGLNRLAMLAGGAATAVFNRGLVMLRAACWRRRLPPAPVRCRSC